MPFFFRQFARCNSTKLLFRRWGTAQWEHFPVAYSIEREIKYLCIVDNGRCRRIFELCTDAETASTYNQFINIENTQRCRRRHRRRLLFYRVRCDRPVTFDR